MVKSATTLTDSLAARLRERVRDNEIDPARDAGAVQLAATELVREHEQRSLTGAVATLDDPDILVGHLVAQIVGLGPLQQYLDDPEVEEIWINEPSRVFVARHGRHELTPTMLSAEQVRELVERMLRTSGRRLDLSQPFVDAELPGGHRLHVVLEGITRGFTAVNIRKYIAKAHALEDLVALGTLDAQAAEFLHAAVVSGLNIIVSGGTQAGKTTLLNCLAASIPGGQRLVSCEEVFELRCGHPDWAQMQTRNAGLEGNGEIGLRSLIKEALRMRPNRIIVGEVRAEECMDLLLALNSGLPGMASLHANSARQALVKMCTLPLLAGENISARFVVPTVAASVDLVIHTAIDAQGQRAVQEIAAITGRVENDIIESEMVFRRKSGQLVRGSGGAHWHEQFARAGFKLEDLLGSSAWASS